MIDIWGNKDAIIANIANIATIMSPIFAILISRHIEKKRFIKDRQLQIFRTLMQHRASLLTPEYVAALNIIEVEFHGEFKVLEARRNLQNCYNKLVSYPELLQNQEVIKLTLKLLTEIAHVLKLNIDAHDIQWGVYYPQFLGNELNKKNDIDNALLAVLNGQKSIRVNDVNQPIARSKIIEQLNYLSEEEREIIKGMVSKNVNECKIFNQGFETLKNNNILIEYRSANSIIYKLEDYVWEYVKNDERFKSL
ncbi:MAG: hypothetical protein Q8K36_05355 [Alphaproteobacteria bacterium]|nr:hypothetical protein [Alphaproteobacteria bacterium]